MSKGCGLRLLSGQVVEWWEKICVSEGLLGEVV
jgi:hypothetical protein